MRRTSGGWRAVLWCSAAAALALAPDRAQAQDDQATSDHSLKALADEARLHVEATGSAWYAALSGKSRFGTEITGADLYVDTDLGQGDDEIAFNGSVDLFIDDHWIVMLDAFDFSTHGGKRTPEAISVNGMMFPGGTLVDGHFGVTSFAAAAGYDFFGNIYERISGPQEGGTPLDIRAHVIGGVRGVNVDHQLNINGGPNVAFDEWGATGNVGVRFNVGIGPHFARRGRWDVSLGLVGGLGGSGSGTLATFDLDFGIHYTVVDSFGLVLGYRQIDIVVDADDASQPYRWDGRVAGLYLGGEVKF